MKTLLAEQGTEVTHARIRCKKLVCLVRSALRHSNTWAFQVDFQDDCQGSWQVTGTEGEEGPKKDHTLRGGDRDREVGPDAPPGQHRRQKGWEEVCTCP